ncbi:hypothetical protein PYCC9005_004014 [Savitreella phatthalungensis]
MAPTVQKRTRILLTGFGPFRSASRNPSWDCACALETAFRNERPDVSIDLAFVPTEYDAVIELIPTLHRTRPVNLVPREKVADDYEDERGVWRARTEYSEQFSRQTWKPESEEIEPYDIILHIGQGHFGKIALESAAHRRGYKSGDHMSRLPPQQAALKEQNQEAEVIHEQKLNEAEKQLATDLGYPLPLEELGISGEAAAQYERLESTFEVDLLRKAVLEGLESPVNLVCSDNAGRYLCEFIYYASLAELQLRKCYAPQTGKTRCAFVHIPPVSDPTISFDISVATVKKILQVAIEQIR